LSVTNKVQAKPVVPYELGESETILASHDVEGKEPKVLKDAHVVS